MLIIAKQNARGKKKKKSGKYSHDWLGKGTGNYKGVKFLGRQDGKRMKN